MRKLFFLALTAFYLSSGTYAQAGAGHGIKENKFRINLPDYWSKGNKALAILADRLPEVCDELKGKDICGDDCKPKYTIDFYLTEPEITGYYTEKIPQPVNTSTRGLSNTVPMLSMTSPQYMQTTLPPLKNNNLQTESFKLLTEYRFQCFLLLKDEKDSILTRIVLVDTNETWYSDNSRKVRSDPYFTLQNRDSYIDRYKDKFVPDMYEMLAIADKKILSL